MHAKTVLFQPTTCIVGTHCNNVLFCRISHRTVDENVLQQLRGKLEQEQARQAKIAAKATERQTGVEAALSTESTDAVPGAAVMEEESMVCDGGKPEQSSSSTSAAITGEPMDTADSTEFPHSAQRESAETSRNQTMETNTGSRPREPHHPKADSSYTKQELEVQNRSMQGFLPGVFPHESAADRDRQRAEWRREQQILRLTPMEPVYPLRDFKVEAKFSLLELLVYLIRMITRL